MTGDDVEALEEAKRQPAVPTESEFRTSDETASVAPTPEPVTCPEPEANVQDVASFEQCVELAIRAGNGYTASTGVCGALFKSEG